jgi:hypothetical protein
MNNLSASNSSLSNVGIIKSSPKYLVAALLMSVGFFFIYWSGSDIPIGVHYDELKKFRQILEGWRNHRHPLFMMHNLDLVRVISSSNDVNQLAYASRILTSAYGALTVLMTFILARLIFGGLPSLIVAVLCGVTPLLGTHSQFVKEDIFVTPLVVGAIYALIRWGQEPSYRGAILLGLFSGLAISAKYSSLVFILPLTYTLIAGNRPRLSIRLKTIAIAILTIIFIFSLVQIPAFMQFGKWAANYNAEVKHAISGHTLILGPLQTGFIYHLKWSLLPGVTWAVLVAAILGIGLVLLRWGSAGLPLQVIVIFMLGWYGVHELSPSKPWQGSIRYMLPMVPFIAVLSVYFVHRCCLIFSAIIGPSISDKIFLVVCTLLIGTTIIASYPVVIGRPDDTRVTLKKYILDQLPGNFLVEHYSLLVKGDARYLVSPGLKEKLSDVDFAIVSELNYARFLFGKDYHGQRNNIYEYAKGYENLFDRPYIQLSSHAHKFSFHNPDIRIIALSTMADDWIRTNAETLTRTLPVTYEIQYVRKNYDTPG